MIDCDRVEIVLPNMKGRVKLFQISDMHITLWNDSDTEYARTSQKERKDLFDGLVKDGVERTEKFEAMYRLAQEEKCDAVILTGDIIDAPSEANFEYLEKTVNSFDIETVFCIGNHDWTHARDYQSVEQREKNMPRFNGIFHKDGNGDCELSVRDYGDFALVSIDDGRGTVSKKALDTLKNFAKSKKTL